MIVIVIYGLIAAAVIGFGVLFYALAVASRKSYRCPQCGEKVKTEYLNAKRCGMCGAPLDRNT